MHNHSNDPKKLNTIHTKPRQPGKPFVLRATRDIKPSDQIYISYTRCNRCWHDETYKDCTTWSHYSSADVFDVSVALTSRFRLGMPNVFLMIML